MLITDKRIEKWLKVQIGHERFTPGLDRVIDLFIPLKKKLKKMGAKIITIGGTNGKGETAHNLRYLLSLNRPRPSIAMWTSPHILTVRERFSFNGELISSKDLMGLLLSNYNEISDKYRLSYYEFLFYTFIKWIIPKRPTHIILEVGLGGKFDTVNLFDADLMAITSISRDHEQILGKGYKNILKEKLGICRSGVPLFTSLELQYLRNIVKVYSLKYRFPWKDLFDEGILGKNEHYYVRNQKLSVVLWRYLSKKSYSIFEFGNIIFPKSNGRFQKMKLNNVNFVFVGAHNIDGFRKLIMAIREEKENDGCLKMSVSKILFSLSKRPIWELKAITTLLAGDKKWKNKIILTKFQHEKAQCQEVLRALPTVEKGLISFVEDWKKFLELELSGKVCNEILVVGSYYFIGQVQEYLFTGQDSK